MNNDKVRLLKQGPMSKALLNCIEIYKWPQNGTDVDGSIVLIYVLYSVVFFHLLIILQLKKNIVDTLDGLPMNNTFVVQQQVEALNEVTKKSKSLENDSLVSIKKI